MKKRYYEKKDYIEAKNQLINEYTDDFQKAEHYIRNLGYGLTLQENCLIQILDDFLCAQKERKPVSKITGNDLRGFCDCIVEAEHNRLSSRKLTAVSNVSLFILVCMIFTLQDAMTYSDYMSIKVFEMLQINCFAISLTSIIFFNGYIKKIILKKYFGNIKKTDNYITVLTIAGWIFAYIIALCLKKLVSFSIHLPAAVYILLTISSIITIVICYKKEKKIAVTYTQAN